MLGKWVPYELSENSIGCRLNICISLLARQRKKNFLWKIVTGDEKWIMYDNPKHTHSWLDPGQQTTSTANPSVHLVGYEGCANCLAEQRFRDVAENTNIPSRTTYHIEFTVENGTMIVAPKHSIFENINHECWSYNQTELDDGNICELVNKVNLERLKADNTTKICVDEKLCPDKEKEEEEKRRAIDLKKQEAKRIEDAKRAENERLRKEKEEQMKNEEIENAKTEHKNITPLKKLSKIHSVTGDEEYIIDEVNKEEDEKNDYLDGKLGNMELEVKSHTTERHFKGEISHEVIFFCVRCD
uniref:WWE domain-containing protein n=1 Tax=Heterorhabditis bacteriophora TaxID=37862 RepID=A0A1I7WVR3_HETBA